MVIHLDIKHKKALLLSIPRDIWIRVPTKSGESFNTKINALYQIGLYPENYPDLPEKFSNSELPAELIKDRISQVTGLNIDYYAAIDFSSFEKIIDGIGGIDVVVDTTFDDYEYPIDGKETELCEKEEQFKQIEKYLNPPVDETEKTEFLKDKPELSEFLTQISDDPVKAFPCRYEHLHFDKGPAHLDGATALKFARSRHSLQDGTDFARGRRQQKVVLAIKEKILSISFLPRIIPLMEELKNDIRTDISIGDVSSLLPQARNVDQYKIYNLVLSNDNYLQSSYSDNGQSILIEKDNGSGWQDIHTWIKETLADITPTPIPSVTGSIKKLKN